MSQQWNNCKSEHARTHHFDGKSFAATKLGRLLTVINGSKSGVSHNSPPYGNSRLLQKTLWIQQQLLKCILKKTIVKQNRDVSLRKINF